MERQYHGFNYEAGIINKFNLNKTKNYTGKFDAYENDIPVSIKCIKQGGSVDFGDLKRQFNLNESFYLYIGFWKNDKNNIVEEYKIFINIIKWKTLFGNIDNNMFDELVSITNNVTDDEKWKFYIKKWKAFYGKGTIQPRFKRDHKSQKRIQCGISYKNFKTCLINTIQK